MDVTINFKYQCGSRLSLPTPLGNIEISKRFEIEVVAARKEISKLRRDSKKGTERNN